MEWVPERVVLVTIDTLRADALGCYGAARAHTPRLDALAADGVRFAVATSPAPLTLPAHATLMTGLQPPDHGVRHNSVFRLDAGPPTLAERMRAHGWATAAVVGAFVLDARFGLARGFDSYDDRLGSSRSGLVGYAERRADAVVDAALAWAASAPPSFFLWVHVYDPHAEYDPPAGFSLAFPDDPYAGEVAFVDAQLGRLLDGLAARFDSTGTLVVVTSDHGEAFGAHGEPTHSYGIYEATQRIPLILSGPGWRGGEVVEAPVELADLAPTLLAAVGAPPLPNAGRDLAAVRAGAAEPLLAYHETLATHLDLGWSALFALRGERWKYVRAPRPELYDLRADPAEAHNAIEEHAEVARELARRLEARLADARPLQPETGLAADARGRLEALGYVVPRGRLGALEELAGPDPKDEIGLLTLLARAESLAARGRSREAYALLAPVQATGGHLPAVRAAYALNAGDAPAAEREIRAALAFVPDSGDYQLLLGRSLEGQGRGADAAAAFGRAARLDPRAAQPWIGLGRVREVEGDPAGAAAAYEAALERAPGEPAAAWRLAALRFEAGASDEALRLLETAQGDAGPQLALRVATAEWGAGRAPSAAARLSRVLAASDAALPPALAPHAAAVLGAGGRSEEALAVSEAALRDEPESWSLQNAVAWGLAARAEQLDRALSLARAAAEASHWAPHVADTLATVHLARGEPVAALRAADRGLAGLESPDGAPHLHYVRAAALVGLGRRAEARPALERALRSAARPPREPWHETALALRRELGAGPDS
ncbi:MAG: sulfatase-like hydrolase/transferase [Myxococcota bacterium]|nr:sulfatase-like hydrolase/transferase [Myxococcota bacterium]